MSRTTVKDVAMHAGVSPQTVSNVLNNHPSIRPKTRDRVLHSIKELDYYPSQAAKALRAARVTSLCCAMYGHDIEQVADPYRNLVQSAFIAEANAHNYSTFTAFLDGRKPQSINALRQRFRSQQFAGMVVVGNNLTAAQWEEMNGWGVKIVLLDHLLPGTNAVTISADYEAGMQALVAHHAAQGRKHLGLILPINSESSSSMGRYQGFLKATEAHGLRTSFAEGNWSFESGSTAMKVLLAQNERPDAILAASDRMATGALRTAHELGLRVPEDIAISGFDDFEFAQYTTPSLTTMHVPHADMARQAVRSLLALLDEPEGVPPTVPSQVFPLSLVVRESA